MFHQTNFVFPLYYYNKLKIIILEIFIIAIIRNYDVMQCIISRFTYIE